MALCSAIITVPERDGGRVKTWKLDWIEGSSFESVTKFFATEKQVPHEDVAKVLHEFEVGGAAKAGPWAAIKYVQDCSSIARLCIADILNMFEQKMSFNLHQLAI